MSANCSETCQADQKQSVKDVAGVREFTLSMRAFLPCHLEKEPVLENLKSHIAWEAHKISMDAILYLEDLMQVLKAM